MPRVLIAGCGYVGKATAELFQTAGWKVECWTATAGTAAGLEREGFVTQAVDIGNRDAVAAAASDFEVVLQCASSGGGSVEAYRHVYLAGAGNLAAVFPRTLQLFTSSTSVYAQTDGEWVTEESEANPQRETGRILRESEEVVLAENLAQIFPGLDAFDHVLERVNELEDADLAEAQRCDRENIGPGGLPNEDPLLLNLADLQLRSGFFEFFVFDQLPDQFPARIVLLGVLLRWLLIHRKQAPALQVNEVRGHHHELASKIDV